MKKKLIIIPIFVFAIMELWSQEASKPSVPLIGAKAPSFQAQSTNGIISFPNDYAGTWKILFSHPKDFTPICSSEILELAQKQNDFDKLNVKIVVVSVDPVDKHKDWKKALEEVKYKDRNPVAINFPLVDDQNLSIAKAYGMLHYPVTSQRDVRGVFVVDPANTIRAIFFYPMEIGRNLDEIERTVIALQTHDSHQVLTPANWKPGEDVFLPYKENETKIDPNVYEISWFMFAKKMN
jgi:peroxiredoxin (alkyl hydroperoxide reductase subunit C)